MLQNKKRDIHEEHRQDVFIFLRFFISQSPLEMKIKALEVDLHSIPIEIFLLFFL